MMKIVPLVLLGCATMCFAQQVPVAPDTDIRAAEAWAFPLNPSAGPRAAKPDVNTSMRVPGS